MNFQDLSRGNDDGALRGQSNTRNENIVSALVQAQRVQPQLADDEHLMRFLRHIFDSSVEPINRLTANAQPAAASIPGDQERKCAAAEPQDSKPAAVLNPGNQVMGFAPVNAAPEVMGLAQVHAAHYAAAATSGISFPVVSNPGNEANAAPVVASAVAPDVAPATASAAGSEAPAARNDAPAAKNPKHPGPHGDSRMNLAVRMVQNDPNMPLVYALQAGGFVFPNIDDLGTPGVNAKTCRDTDGVSLYQRRNQLMRRLRTDRRAQEANGNNMI